jgi:membrane protein DedA with SNARE-associated domain/rhodanese-related sulfurtransferase
MDDVTEFLIRYGQLLLFVIVFAEQVGLPIPAIPILLAAGAIAGAGILSLPLAIGVSVIASLLGDLIWYYLGRYRGRQVLNLLCRISLEPDSCVRRTEDYFVRHGVRALLVAKFIPGLSTVMPSLAGLFNVSLGQFLLYNGLGALLWTVAFIMPGYLFSDQIERLAGYAEQLGSSALVLAMAALALYIMYKYVNRIRLFRELRIARITVEELKQLMDAGNEVMIVDLRRPSDRAADPYTIPGSLQIAVQELESRHHEIPRDRDVILYCACPNEVTSAQMAVMLKRRGIKRVRPLVGGVESWRASNYPLTQLTDNTGV